MEGFEDVKLEPADSVTVSQLEKICTQNLFHLTPTPKSQTIHTKGRFGQPLPSQQFYKELANRIPKSTQKSTQWALQIYKEWRTWRNFLPPTKSDTHWPIPSLEDGSLTSLDYWLARFVTEVHRQDGTPYTASKHIDISIFFKSIFKLKF